MESRYSERGIRALFLPFSLLILGFIQLWSPTSYSQQSTSQPPAPKVEFLRLEQSQVRQWTDFSAQISAVESVEVRPLVGGRIDNVLFREGEDVNRGQPLFTIDPRPYQAAVKKAEASLATAKAHARLTSQELSRSRDLINAKLISQSVYDEALTNDDIAQASVMQAQSSLLEAQLNLENAYIVAPISGRVGRAELTVGNIVGSGPSAPVLTTIVARDNVYAEFRVDERTFLSLSDTLSTTAKLPVQLVIDSGKEAFLEGYVHAFDNRLDSTSGTIRTRAIFENSDDKLVPGMYVDVRLGSANMQNTLLIPERAIGTNQDRKFVYVIDESNTAQYREIVLGKQHHRLRSVDSGLQAGERIVIKGLARIRPNTPVDPIESEISEEFASIKI